MLYFPWFCMLCVCFHWFLPLCNLFLLPLFLSYCIFCWNHLWLYISNEFTMHVRKRCCVWVTLGILIFGVSMLESQVFFCIRFPSFPVEVLQTTVMKVNVFRRIKGFKSNFIEWRAVFICASNFVNSPQVLVNITNNLSKNY